MDRGAYNVSFVEKPAPQVHLISRTANPLPTLATVTRGYSQVYDPFITTGDVNEFLKELESTSLQTPLDFLSVVFLIKNVTRVFTHQIVRYRIGTAFVQESMRFAETDQIQILMPKSLGVSMEPEVDAELYRKRQIYRQGCRAAVSAYYQLLELGVPIQEARGAIPHNVLTSIFVQMSMRTLAHIHLQRTCCQALDHEWTPVLAAVRQALIPTGLDRFLKFPWDVKASCGFNASFDRPCTQLEKFGPVAG